MTTKAYQIEGVWPTVRDDDWCGEWKILPRRPAMAPIQQGAVGAVATVTSLVAAVLADARELDDERLLPAAAAMHSVVPDLAVAMAAD